MCVCVCVCVCVRARVRVHQISVKCVCACELVRMCVRVCGPNELGFEHSLGGKVPEFSNSNKS